jgi:hypothetical protein
MTEIKRFGLPSLRVTDKEYGNCYKVALAASTGEDAATLTVPISYNDDPATLSYIGLTTLAAVLKPRFERLNHAFAPENYPATHSRMVQIERAVHPK